MTLTLLLLAAIAAANPFRVASASPTPDRLRAVFVAVVVTSLAVVAAAAASGPLLDAIDVTGPSARIAAGIALAAVAAKDVFASPPEAEPGLSGWRAGVVPLALPVMFSPALALIAIAGGSDRGVIATGLVLFAALLVAGLAALRPPNRGLRGLVAVVGVLGIAVAALVVLDGVYSI
jgi:small neutral amino acid transporter SnatA (MarC family)